MRETLSTKKPLVIIIAAALVVIGALLVYGIIVTPARQPYRDALAQYQNVDRALARTNIAFNTSTASDEEFQKSIEAAQAAFKSLNTENTALGKMAVLQEGEGKALYDVYHKKLVGYAVFSGDVITSMVKVRPVLVKCSSAMNTATQNSEGATVLKSCAVEMQAASDVPDADYKVLAETFAQNYESLANIFGEVAALADPQGADAARYAELEAERDQAVKNLETAGTTFSSDIQQHRQEILATDAAKNLNNYLTNKSRIF